MDGRPIVASKGKVTSDHDEIRRWAEVRNGRPMAVQGAEPDNAQPILLVFPGVPRADTDDLRPISWDEWFRRLDDHDLALLIEETTSAGQQSRFNKLVRR